MNRAATFLIPAFARPGSGALFVAAAVVLLPCSANSLEHPQSEAEPVAQDTDADRPSGDSEAEVPTVPVDTAPSAAIEPPVLDDPVVLDELIVTANRRTQNLRDVGNSIRVLDGTDLERAGADGLADYIFKVPGVDLVDSGLQRTVAIRGIGNPSMNAQAAGSSTSPIGLYLNDTPIQGNGTLPDLALYDLERIEVLKGPQGTLYGEGAQGGAIKMLLARADPFMRVFKSELGIGRAEHGGGLSNFQKFAFNVPLWENRWGVRLVGSRSWDAGFIDYFNVPAQDPDEVDNFMGRIQVDGRVGDSLGVSALVLHQRQRIHQFAQAQLAEGDLRNRFTEPQFGDTDFALGGLTLDWDLEFATLTSSTSGFDSVRETLGRFPSVGIIAAIAVGPEAAEQLSGAGAGAEREWLATLNEQFSIAQELRLVSATDGWIDWVAGAFYRARRNAFDYVLVTDAGTEQPPAVPEGAGAFGIERFTQLAGFGEITLHPVNDLELTAGLRGFREAALLDGTAVWGGPFYPFALLSGEPDGTVGPYRFETATTEVTPKVALSWFATEGRMFYALAANGVRSGGTNVNALSTIVPPLFAPDSLWTYEIGAKTDWLDRLITVNLAVFHNAWTDLQIRTAVSGNRRGPTDPATGESTPVPPPQNVGVVLNVGEAFSEGVELELRALPLAGLALSMDVTLMRGEITQGDAAGHIPAGTPLPQLSELSYAAAISYELPRWRLFGFMPALQFDMQRTGPRLMSPPSSGFAAAELDGFELYNAMFLFIGDTWDGSVGIRNIGDARPQLGAHIFQPDTLTFGPPRTVTARVGFRF